MSSSTNIPSEPVIPNRQESAPPVAGGQTKLQSRRAPRSIPRRADSPAPQISFAQERFWLLEQLEPGSPAYNRPFALRLTGRLDESALRRSLQTIVDRHEILRTRFTARDGQALPVVSHGHTVQLPLIEPADADSGQRLKHALRLAKEESLRPFDLAHESPFRATLLRLSGEDHLLLMVFHHIAFDGWSARVFQDELATLYRQFHSGELPCLPELPIQYSDFAHWQRREFASPNLTSASNYWTTRLSDVQPLDLPADRPRPKVQSHHGACVAIVLPECLAASLKALGRQENATLFMVLLAAFQALLARYSGIDDIAVGSPVAGRNWLETENLIGIFINILVLRSDLSGDLTFREFLACVRETCRGAYRHQDLSFSHVVEAVKPQRDLSTTPLFQVMFNLENLPESQIDTPGLHMEVFEFERPVADYELTLEVVPANGRLKCLFTYNTDIFDRSTIERMTGHYQTLLEGIVAEPDRRVASLPVASAAEQQKVLVEWNRTEADYPREATIHRLFEEQAARIPTHTAYYSENGNLSYGVLDRRSNQLAHYIRGQGVTPESLVGVCLNRSPEAIIAILGILKAGAAFVPLDPAYPRERLEFMISDARISLVISRQEWKPLIAAKGAQVICLDTDHLRIDSKLSDPCPYLSGPKSTAYVLYTSGSSGVPKGVTGLHRGAVNRFAWMWKNFPFKPGEVCCLKTSLNFVDSIWEIFGPLLQGIPSVMLSEETVRDPAKMVRKLARFGVTRIVTVPSLLRVMLEGHHDLGTRLPAMRLWGSSGEALEPDLCRRFYQAVPQATLLNLYGSTEVAADVTAYVVPPNLDHRATIPLGRPIHNTRCYVLDAKLQPVPIGARGDLYVGGDGLARGYCNRPELTAERFLDDPFSTNPNTRLYKTGDRARYLPDGNLEYLGRADQQVKVRGFRIELNEIEAVLSLHPQIAAAAATVQEGVAQDKHLVAYVVGPRGKTPPTPKALSEFLKLKLPAYMVPAEFVILDSLPMTPNGKLDRRALHAKSPSRPAMKCYVPPEDPVEWQLVKIWEELLGTRTIGIVDNFFDLGGHSLLAIRMMDRIEQAYGNRLPLSTLFAEATVLHLADCLRLESVRECASPVVPVQTEGLRPPFFYLHGDLGGGLYCRTLAQLFGPDQPLYGVMPSGVDGKPFLPTVEAMAEENVGHLLAVHPEGPYLLGGYCNGGVVAYEMAQQLLRHGREVGMLILLDTWVPRYFGWLRAIVHNTRGPSRPDADRRAQVYIRLRNYLVRTHWAYHQGTRALLSLYLKKAGRVIRQSLRSSDREVGGQAPGSSASDPWNFLGYPEFGRIISSYRPRPYPGRVILLRTRYLEESYPTDRTAGWGRLARDLEIRELPGDHHNCLTEHLGDVAAHIRRCLIGYTQTTDMELVENSRR